MNQRTFLAEAVTELAGPGTSWYIGSDKILVWRDNVASKPSESAIQTKMVELRVAYDAQAYARSRKEEYPSIEDCIHSILDNELEALQVKRQAVKAKYPKP